MADIPGNTSSRVVLPIGERVAGVFETENDADWYRVRLDAGTNYAFQARVSDGGDDFISAEVTLRNASGRVLADSYASDYEGLTGGFDYRPTASGTFFFALETDTTGNHSVLFEVDEPREPPTSTRIEPGQSRDEEFLYSGDDDTFAIRLEQGQAYDFAIQTFFGDDTNLAVLDDSGRVLFDSFALEEPRSSSFDRTDALIEDFRAPYTGNFFLRAENLQQFPVDYRIAAEADPAAGPFDPGAPPSGEDDLLLGRSGAADRINGLAGDDLIDGRGGNDDLQGGAGTDAVLGGDGKDFVFGGPGRDRLYGGNGDDKLGGDRGTDVYTGGAGRDVFDMGSRPEFDSITDFARGTDKIDLRKVDANTAAAGDQAFTFVGTREPTAAGQLGYEYDRFQDRTEVTGRTGDEFAEINFTLDGKVTLSADDLAL